MIDPIDALPISLAEALLGRSLELKHHVSSPTFGVVSYRSGPPDPTVHPDLPRDYTDVQLTLFAAIGHSSTTPNAKPRGTATHFRVT